MIADDNVLYRRASASEMLQGIADTVRLLRLEIDKLKQFHNEAYQFSNSHMPGLYQVENQINALYPYTFDLDRVVLEMRRKGL